MWTSVEANLQGSQTGARRLAQENLIAMLRDLECLIPGARPGRDAPVPHGRQAAGPAAIQSSRV